MIKVENLKKSYGELNVLKNINFELYKGETISLLGKNGAGKSTLIKIMTGILAQDEGSVTINGICVYDDDMTYKKSFGYVPDTLDFFDHITGIEYLNFLINIYKLDKDYTELKISKLLELLDMKQHINSKIETYSRGTKQKIMIIGAIMHEPDILILDEPFSGLDIEMVYVTKNIFKEFAQNGKTIMFSTHIVEISETLADRIIIINDGIIVLDKDMKKIKESEENLEELFIQKTKER